MTAANFLAVFNDAPMVAAGSPTNNIVDASNEGIAWGFQTYSADPITHLGFRYGARTGTPPVYSIALEGLDASGTPDGTDVGGGSPTLVTFTPPADTSIDGLWQWKALTNSYTPTRGQALAAVIRYSSGTIDGSNNSSFTRVVTTFGAFGGLPYGITNSGGTWSKSAAGACFGWRTASGRYGQIFQSAYATNSATTAGHQSLMYFTLPAGHGDTFTVLGFRGPMLRVSGGGGSYKGVLLQSDGTVIQSVTLDADHQANPGTNTSSIIFDETSLTALSYGTKYYIGLEYASGASGVGLRGAVLAESDDRSAYANGTNRGLVTYDGSYTETNTVMPFIELILDDITEPSGGGGGPLIGGRLVR